MNIEFPPPLIKRKTNIPQKTLVWEKGKGWHVEDRKYIFQFPPPLISLEFKKK